MNTLIPISIVIGDRTYRIKVEAKEEELVRKTVRFINEKIADFKQNFAGKDMQDFISMALIFFATQPGGNLQLPVDSQALDAGFSELHEILDKAIAT